MKAVGVLVIALGLILIVIGIQGSQGNVLQTLRGINPKLRQTTGTSGVTSGGTAQQQATSSQSSGGTGPQVNLA